MSRRFVTPLAAAVLWQVDHVDGAWVAVRGPDGAVRQVVR